MVFAPAPKNHFALLKLQVGRRQRVHPQFIYTISL